MLPSFFQPGIAIANHAAPGETVQNFYDEARFAKVLSLVRQGDYLLIQFGHDEQKEMRPGVNSISAYRNRLYTLIHEVKERGAIPVLITPPHRLTFDERGQIYNSLGGYPDAIINLARSTNTPLIDLHGLSEQLYESLGPERSALLFVNGDNTSHNSEGANRLAQRVVVGIKRNQLDLMKYLVVE
jgi:hypothetical protein